MWLLCQSRAEVVWRRERRSSNEARGWDPEARPRCRLTLGLCRYQHLCPIKSTLPDRNCWYSWGKPRTLVGKSQSTPRIVRRQAIFPLATVLTGRLQTSISADSQQRSQSNITVVRHKRALPTSPSAPTYVAPYVVGLGGMSTRVAVLVRV